MLRCYSFLLLQLLLQTAIFCLLTWAVVFRVFFVVYALFVNCAVNRLVTILLARLQASHFALRHRSWTGTCHGMSESSFRYCIVVFVCRTHVAHSRSLPLSIRQCAVASDRHCGRSKAARRAQAALVARHVARASVTAWRFQSESDGSGCHCVYAQEPRVRYVDTLLSCVVCYCSCLFVMMFV